MSGSMFQDVARWDDETGPEPTLELRRTCMDEEWGEWIEALAEGERDHIAKEGCDVVWTVLAMMKGYGIPVDSVWQEIVRSNRAKIDPDVGVVRRNDGKIIKPPGWTPPDVKGILAAADHEHTWQPNGQVEVEKVSHSPVSRWDDTLYTEVYSVALCSCGKTQTTLVARKNVRDRSSEIEIKPR